MTGCALSISAPIARIGVKGGKPFCAGNRAMLIHTLFIHPNTNCGTMAGMMHRRAMMATDTRIGLVAPGTTEPVRDFVVPETGGHGVVAASVFQGSPYPIVLKPELARTVVDVGANCGAASAWFRLHYPDAYIRAYEPHPVAFSYLERNARTFDFDARPHGLWMFRKRMFLRDGIDECGTVVASVCRHQTNTDAGHEVELRGVTDEIGD